MDSPWSSAPSTNSAAVVAVTTVGDADAAVATVGAALLTVTFVNVDLLSSVLLLLFAESPTSTLDAIEIVKCGSERAEAAKVAWWLRRRNADDGIAWREMAVFYRTNSLSRVMEEALREAQE